MKKQRHTSKTRRKPTKGAEPSPTPMTRRDMLRLARNGAIGLAAVGGVGAYVVQSFRAHATEHDLSRIGKGTPSIVQIHDPQCALCRELQTETRAALEDMSDAQVTYVVANIRTSEGRALAARHGVSHVTLLLMDGNGRVQRVIQGVQSRAVLRDAFTAHIRANSS
ncbi:MAG: hypothetical protein AAGD12_10145 [Pseudomonadota bacterium]